MPTQKRIVLVDGTYYIFRAYHGLKQTRSGGRGIDLKTTYGMPTGALLVFSNMLLRLVLDEKPELCAVVFDAGGGSFRTELSTTYKANRTEPPDDLKVQFPWFDRIVDAFRLPVIRKPGVEADDVIATMTRVARAQGIDVVIYSADKDLMQLVDDHVRLVDAMRDVVYDEARVEEKFGVPPRLVGDWLALVGDPIDNVPGIPGLGDKTATALLKQWGSLEGILAHVDELQGRGVKELRNPERVEALRTSRKLVSLDGAVQGLDEPASYKRHDWALPELTAIFRELEFNSLIPRLEASFVSDRDRYVTILDQGALDALVVAARAAGEVAFALHTVGPDPVRASLVGIALATAGHPAAYVPLAHRYLGAPRQLSAERALDALRALVDGDDAVPSYVHDSKDAIVVLERHGVRLRKVRCDSMLASYLLDPSHPQHALPDVAKDSLSHACLSLESVTGRGKEHKPFDESDLTVALPYAAETADVTLALGKLLRRRVDGTQLTKLLDEVEQPLSRVLAKMQRDGIKVDLSVLAPISDKLGDECAALERRIHDLAGYAVNPGSPKQIGELLFERLGLRSERMRRTKTGAYSTDADILEDLVDQHPIVKPILEHRELIKLKNTYVDSLPGYVNPQTGRLHTSYSQTIATTGRLASTNPNLQNIPIRTAQGREIRRAFVAESGWRLLSADYSQIELRVLAHLSGDAVLCDAFARDLDVHAQTAAEVFGVPLDKVDANMRRVAKAVNYGLGYGQSEFGLSRALDIPREEARRYIDIYFTRFAGVRDFMERVIATAHETGHATTILGRKLPIAGLQSGRYQERTAAERFARNAPIQGSAADILKLAMLGVERVLDGGRWRARMLLTVHDELVFEVPAEEAGGFAEVAKREMEIAWPLKVPLKVDVGIAESWADAH